MRHVIFIVILLVMLFSCSITGNTNNSPGDKAYAIAVKHVMSLNKTKDFFLKQFGHSQINYCVADSTKLFFCDDLIEKYILSKYRANSVSYEKIREINNQLRLSFNEKMKTFESRSIPKIPGANCEEDHLYIHLYNYNDSLLVAELYPRTNKLIGFYKTHPNTKPMHTEALSAVMCIDIHGDIKYSYMVSVKF